MQLACKIYSINKFTKVKEEENQNTHKTFLVPENRRHLYYMCSMGLFGNIGFVNLP